MGGGGSVVGNLVSVATGGTVSAEEVDNAIGADKASEVVQQEVLDPINEAAGKAQDWTQEKVLDPINDAYGEWKEKWDEATATAEKLYEMGTRDNRTEDALNRAALAAGQAAGQMGVAEARKGLLEAQKKSAETEKVTSRGRRRGRGSLLSSGEAGTELTGFGLGDTGPLGNA